MSASGEQPDLPEIKLKAGFKSPIGSSDGSGASSGSGSALSIDDMLAITSGRRPEPKSETPPPEQSPPPPAPKAPPPPPAAATAPAAPPPPPAAATAPPPPPAAPSPAPAPPPAAANFGFNVPPPADPFGRASFPQPTMQKPDRLGAVKDLIAERGKTIAIGAVASLALVMLLIFGATSLFKTPIKLLIESTPAGAAVYLGEEHLGDTPLKIELYDLDEMPVLKLDGYETREVRRPKKIKEDKRNIVKHKLKGVSFPLDWGNLPEGTRVWWKGAESQPDTTNAGKYSVKIKPKNQSSFVWSLEIPWSGGDAYPIGQNIAKEIARRPVLKLSLKGMAKAEVIVKDGPRFTHIVTINKKTGAGVTLPGPGKYAVKVKGTGFDKSVEVKEAEKKSLTVDLTPSYSAPSGGGGYNAPRTYRPRRRYSAPPRYTGGGGGAGAIAPPSF